MKYRNIFLSLTALTFTLNQSFSASPPPPETINFNKVEYNCRSAGEFLQLSNRSILRYEHINLPEHQNSSSRLFLMYWHPEWENDLYFYTQPENSSEWSWVKRENENSDNLYYLSLSELQAISKIHTQFNQSSLPTLKDGGYFLAGYGLVKSNSNYFQEMLNSHRYKVIWQYRPDDQVNFGEFICTPFDTIEIHR